MTEGRLSEGAVPGLLRELYVGRRSGMLSFERGSEQRGVRFRTGHIIHADTNVREDRMGEVMVRHGRLSAQDLKRALGFAVRDGRRLGAVLLEQGLLTSEQLDDALALHVHEILSKVFTWRDGSYRFSEEAEVGPLPDDITLKVSTGGLILEAARSVADADVVRYCLGDIDRVLGLASDPLLRFQRVNLTPTDGFVLSRVDGTLSARKLVAMIPLPAEEVHRSLFGLLSTAMIEYVSGQDTPRLPVGMPVEAAAPSPAASPAAVGDAPPAPPAPAAVPRPTAATVAKPPPSPPAPEPAYEETIRMEAVSFPPEPASGTAIRTEAVVPPLEPTIRMDPAELAAALASLPPRAGNFTRAGAEASPRAPEGTAPEATMAEAPAPEATAPDALVADDPRRLEILEMHAGLATRTHFEVLGVDRGASDAMVKEAYFRLAKRFHPDVHHDPALADLRDQVEAIFVRLGEAYEVLRNARLRAGYENKLDPRTGKLKALKLPEAPDPAREAEAVEQAIRGAATSLAADKHWEAIRVLEHAILRAEGKALLEARVLLARAYMRDANWVKQGEELLRAVVRDAPDRAEAHRLLAQIYRAQKLHARAASALRRVLEIDPDDAAARSQLEELAAAADSPGKGPPGGLLRKLFPRG
jgi:tetratricopeptide (TPR) repeat protein